MNGRAVKWAVALVLSAVLHVGAAVWFGIDPDAVEVAGGAQAEIAVLGNAFQDSLAAGSASEAVEPTENEAEAIPPAATEQATEAPVEPASPTASEAVAEAAKPEQPQAVAESAQATPTKAIAETPQESLAPADSNAAPTANAATVESSAGEIAIAALEPAKQEAKSDKPIAPARHDTVEPVEADVPPMSDTAPRPTPRPAEIAKAEPNAKAAPVQKKAETKPREKPRQRAGAGGANKQNTRRGSADGSDKARKTEAGVSGRSREAGNAAVSNYPGKVYSKLRRSLRYPAEARRKHIRGEVHVRFTVSRAGRVGSISVARSSGSPVLDKAALETVRRAAPFPEIPAEAGRSSWSFTVPLAFTR